MCHPPVVTLAGEGSNDEISRLEIYGCVVGLGPFVETLPTFGTVGASVRILGTNLAGATSVSFNGTGATFTVVSASEITTAVPSGATTG